MLTPGTDTADTDTLCLPYTLSELQPSIAFQHWTAKAKAGTAPRIHGLCAHLGSYA